ncbi:brain acid soluble protein 1-like [Varroa jacobsoni]|uniref:brain acid soluble protein 1-like n=1 Tax=Varroa jacobsoni TaxID=62625 RepID=UPI000BF8A45E|nr:brain acid soluble protein 1-like [Varroa jacobsoni]
MDEPKLSKKPSTSDLIMNTLREMPKDRKGHSVLSLKKAILESNPEIGDSRFNTRFNKTINTMLEKNLLARPKGAEDAKGATGRVKIGETKSDKEREKPKAAAQKDQDGASTKKLAKDKDEKEETIKEKDQEKVTKKTGVTQDDKSPKKATVLKASKTDDAEKSMGKKATGKKASASTEEAESPEKSVKPRGRPKKVQNGYAKAQENGDGPAEESAKKRVAPKPGTTKKGAEGAPAETEALTGNGMKNGTKKHSDDEGSESVAGPRLPAESKKGPARKRSPVDKQAERETNQDPSDDIGAKPVKKGELKAPKGRSKKDGSSDGEPVSKKAKGKGKN